MSCDDVDVVEWMERVSVMEIEANIQSASPPEAFK